MDIQRLKVLLIEDDSIEVMKFKRAISSIDIPVVLVEASNGEAALKVLENHQNLPDIILLDLNMPKINGIEFLRVLKANTVLQYLPTVVLTTSSNRKDMMECFKMGVAGYILKPLKYEAYIHKIHTTILYWSENELIKI